MRRRAYLATTGTLGMWPLAGCSAGEGNDEPEVNGTGDDETATGERERRDVYFAMTDWRFRGSTEYNPFNVENFEGWLFPFYDKFASFNLETRTWVPYGLESWEIGEEETRLELRDGLVWSDGIAITAEDLAVQLRLERWRGDVLWEYVTAVRAVDDGTVVLDLAAPVNEAVFEHVLLDRRIVAPAHAFGKYLERIQDGEDPDAVMTEVTTEEWEEPITSGPFELEETTGEYNRFRTRDDHPDAEHINFSGYDIFSSQFSHWYPTQFLMDGEIDGIRSWFVPKDTIEQFPDEVDEIQLPGSFGLGLVFNHDDAFVGHRDVRRAIAFAIDAQLVAGSTDPRVKVVPAVPAGISSWAVEHYLGDAVDTFEPYEPNPSRAVELLEEAGFVSSTSESSEDVEGSGLAIEITYIAGWSDWKRSVETVAEQLEGFGIDVELTSIPRLELEETLADGDFQVAAFEWNRGSVEHFHPYYSLRHQLRNRQLDPDSSFLNYPEVVTVPAMDGAGEITVDVEARLDELASATDEDEARAIISELAWVANQDLPMLPLHDRYEQSFLRNDRWDYPDDSASVTQHYWPQYWLARQGELRATGE